MRTIRSAKEPIEAPLAPSPYAREPMKPISLKLSDVQLKRLDKARKLTGRQKAELLRNAIDDYLTTLGV